MKKYFFLTLFFLFPSFASAALEIRYPRIGTLILNHSTEPHTYVQYLFNFSLIVIGILAFFSLVWAGFQYLTSAGNVEVQKKSKERIKATFLALFILLFSYLILTLFKREWGQLSSVSPSMVGAPAAPYPTSNYTSDPLIHIHDTAKTMREKAESIQKESGDFKNLLSECTCENLIPACAFAPECKNTGCVGEPCKNRKDIEKEQIKLRMKLIELLFYYRLLVDATTEEHLTSALWRRETTPQIQEKLQKLRDLVEELKEPVNQIRQLIPEYTELANRIKINGNCESDCEVQSTDSVKKCVPLVKNCRLRKNASPLYPKDDLERILERGSPSINNSIGRIIETLQKIESFTLSLL